MKADTAVRASPFRVLQVITRPQRRGAEIFAVDLCRELERRGHATRIVALYTPEEGGELPMRSHDLRLDGDGASPLERVPGFQPALLRRLLSAIDGFAPDVVQVNGSRTVKYGSLARRRRRDAPWALVYRSIGTPADWVGNRLRRELYRHTVVSCFDAVVAVSRGTLASLERCYRIQVPAVVLPRAVNPGPDPEPGRRALRQKVRQRLGTGADAPVVLYAGRLSREKRPDRSLRVCALAVKLLQGLGPPELWIAGDGPLRPEVERLAAAAAYPVRVLGEQDDILSLMAAADLLLLTSDTEGLPGVVLEAGCMGLPAVVTRVGGVEDCVHHGETGLVVEPDDESGMARAVAALLSDDPRRHDLGKAARRLVVAEFSLPVVAEGYLQHYRRALARRPVRDS